MLGLLAILFSLTNCQTRPDDDLNPQYETKFEPGFGDSEEHPTGTPFKWPKGITMVGELRPDFDCFQEADKQKRHYGNGGQVFVCMHLVNSTQKPLRVTLPPGLMLVSESIEVQNGIIVDSLEIEVPAEQQLFTLINAFCVNGSRKSGISPSFTYEPQLIITDHPGMRELCRLVANKKFHYEQYGRVRTKEAILYGSYVGAAVSNIAHGDPIYGPILEQIKSIPNKR